MPALNFVTACANIRMFIFNIKQKSRFEVKGMTDNIIPVNTNAVIAGCIVMEALKILNNQIDRCKFVNTALDLVTVDIDKPSHMCIVCRDDPDANVSGDKEKLQPNG